MLAARGVPQRLVVRDPSRAPELDGADVVAASFEDESAMRTALAGVDTLFLISAPESADRMPVHRSAVRAATAAGVSRTVHTSFMGASPQATFTFAREHSLTEQLIVESGLGVTALRSSLYADEVPDLVQDGVIRGPAGRGRVAWVTRHDIARWAAETLLDTVHADHVYDVSGPAPIDLHETARILSTVIGRTISYLAETDDEARASRAVPRSGRSPGGPAPTGASPPVRSR
ncbi:NAD(P)H-binding protein [Kocuria sp. NPDC057446]|uniref:NAD(P)H-binding protein n=1 Tax=Kocuria sp. NPDC057446 TaxID=3346137 RepID=UPI0036A45D40